MLVQAQIGIAQTVAVAATTGKCPSVLRQLRFLHHILRELHRHFVRCRQGAACGPHQHQLTHELGAFNAVRAEVLGACKVT